MLFKPTYLAAPRLFCAHGVNPLCGLRVLVPLPGIKPGPVHWERAVPATGPPGQSQSSCFLEARSPKGPPTSTGSWGARRASCCSRGLKVPCRSPLGAPTRKFSASHTGPGVQACNEMVGPGRRRVLGAQGLRDPGLSCLAAGPGSPYRLQAQSRQGTLSRHVMSTEPVLGAAVLARWGGLPGSWPGQQALPPTQPGSRAPPGRSSQT